MPKFLIEVPHANSKADCLRAINIFRSTGSHFLTHADWGCPDDIHKAWFVVELDSKKQALAIVPPWYREQATVITLEQLALDTIDHSLAQHQD